MTPCLTPDEFVDLVDGTLPQTRRAHVDTCDRCQTTADELRQTWQAATMDVPEPSALFWPSLNARVRAAIAAPAGARPRRWWHWPMLAPATVVLTAAVVALVTTLSRPEPSPESDPRATPTDSASAQPATPPTAGESGAGPIEDPSLQLVIDLAGELPNGAWELLGVSALPELGVAAAVLSNEEQRALAALLEAEVSRPKS